MAENWRARQDSNRGPKLGRLTRAVVLAFVRGWVDELGSVRHSGEVFDTLRGHQLADRDLSVDPQVVIAIAPTQGSWHPLLRPGQS
jgi:hypothetical protein